MQGKEKKKEMNEIVFAHMKLSGEGQNPSLLAHCCELALLGLSREVWTMSAWTLLRSQLLLINFSLSNISRPTFVVSGGAECS